MEIARPASVSHSVAYRPDIDGLRALAVVPVVLFHVGFSGVYGGYVGVDIFFVISGYLITGILAREMSVGRYSLLQFYRRRALRIFPALFAVLAATTVVATLCLLPSELRRYGWAAIAATGFFSNIQLYFTSGYFAPAAHSMPLLHTWSLAVEEQFYIFWPLLLWLIQSRAPSRRRLWTAIIAAISFAFSAWLLPRDGSATFYLLPPRAWELLLGALLALGPVDFLRRRYVREAVAAAGGVAILLSIHFFNQQTPFPGPSALLPCLGAVALIAAGGVGPSLATRALSLAPVVFVGQVSYSLYLWHWPVIVFAKIGLFLDDIWWVKVLETVVSFVLAVVSWRFIEQPFRVRWAKARPGPVLAWSGLAMGCFIALGAGYVASQGFPGRLTPSERELAAFETYNNTDSEYRFGTCFVTLPEHSFDWKECLGQRPGKPSLLVVGDSHAAQLWPGLSRWRSDIDVLQATATGCRPLLYEPSMGEPLCREFFRQVFTEWLPQHPVDVIVVAGRWEGPDLLQLPQTLAALQAHARKVVVLGPIPQYATILPRLLVRSEEKGDPTLPSRAMLERPFKLDPEIRDIASRAGVDFISLIGSLCTGHECRQYAVDKVPLQYDYGHLTVEGSDLVVDSVLAGKIGLHAVERLR